MSDDALLLNLSNVNNSRCITLYSRFGYKYIACKPQDRFEDNRFGAPVSEFWTNSFYAEQFLYDLPPWKNDEYIIERLFNYLAGSNSLNANIAYKEMVDFITLHLEQRQLLMFLIENKKPLYIEDYPISKSTPLPFVLLQGNKLIDEDESPTDNWVSLEYQYADGTGINGASYQVYNKVNGNLIASGSLDANGRATAALPMDVDDVDVVYSNDPAELLELIVQPESKIIESAPQSNWLQRIGNSIADAANWTWGTLKGDFNENPTVGQVITNAILTSIPVVDQVGDVRDIVACIKYFVWDKRYNEPMMWVGLVLTAVGLIPFVGSALKGILILVVKSSKLSELLEVFNYFYKGDGVKWLKNLYNGELMRYISEAAQITTDIFNEMIATLLKTKQYVPAYATDVIQKIDEKLETLQIIKSQINDKFSKVGEDLRGKLGKSLDEEIPPVSGKAKETIVKKQEKEVPHKLLPSERKKPSDYSDEDYKSLNNKKAAAGEYNANEFMLEQGNAPLGDTGKPYAPGITGIDGVYKGANPPPDYIITDAKYDTSPLGMTADGRQMSDPWVTRKRLLKAGIHPDDIQKISDGLFANDGTVQKLVIRNKSDGYLEMKELNALGKKKTIKQYEVERQNYANTHPDEVKAGKTQVNENKGRRTGEWYVTRFNQKSNLF